MSIGFNETTIERLVHGELDLVERNAVLRQLDEQPGAWRRLALAFVEKQMLDAVTQDRLRASARDNDPAVASAETTTVRSTRRSRASRSQTSWLWTAACLGAAVAIGYFAATLRQTVTESPRRATVASTESEPAAIENATNLMALEEALARCTATDADTLRWQLLEAGILVDPNHRMRRVVLPTGGELLMPVRGYDVRLLGASTYQ